MLPARLLTNLPTQDKGAYSPSGCDGALSAVQGVEEQEALIAQSYAEVAALLSSRSAPQPSAVIQRVKEIISRKYSERLSVTSLAQEAYLTPTTVRIVQAADRQDINEYITLERVRHAKELLTDSSILLYDVCFMVAPVAQLFFKAVQKVYGVTPSEFGRARCSARGRGSSDDRRRVPRRNLYLTRVVLATLMAVLVASRHLRPAVRPVHRLRR